MEIKFNLLSIRSLFSLVLALGCGGCSHAELLAVNGQAVLEDGQPIENGVVVIAELQGRPLSMPSVSNSVETKTDGAGRFAAELNYQGGDVNISLDAAPCKWNVAFVRLKASNLKGLRTVTPKLVAKPMVGTACDRTKAIKGDGG